MIDASEQAGQANRLTVEAPADLVAQSPLARRLGELGATDGDLTALQFSKFKPAEQPFSMWAVWAPQLLPQQEERVWRLMSEHFDLCKAHCAYRWLLLDNPPSSPNTEAAWNYITHVLAIPIYESGIRARENQQKRAQKPRAAVGDGGESLHQIIGALSSKPEYRELRAKQLWPHLRSALDDHGLDPVEVDAPGDIRTAAYTYDFQAGRRRISFGSFANIISRLRKKSS
jgi:hypothetical protein